MKIFVCNNYFEDMMTCIYDAWVMALKCGHENVFLTCEPIFQESILDEYIYVEADKEKTEKVVRSIASKMGDDALYFIKYASLSHDKEALDAIYRFMIQGFKMGHGITDALSMQEVIRLMELKRNVGREAQYFKEFVRFVSIGNKVYVAHIEPKNNVLEIVGRHFEERMPSENFMIVDDIRGFAIVHPKDSECYIMKLTEEELATLIQTDEIKDEYSSMWKVFFDTIAIKERTNKRCQQTLLPLWMRKHMTEFK